MRPRRVVVRLAGAGLGLLGMVAVAAGASKPDLVVSSVQANAQCAANGTLTATIFARVKNQGQGPADLSKIPWQIIVKAEWYPLPGPTEIPPKPVEALAGGPMSLQPGQWIQRTLTVKGIPKHQSKTGQLGFLVTADPWNRVAETDEENNAKWAHPYYTCPAP